MVRYYKSPEAVTSLINTKMKRRKFIKDTLAGMPLFLAAPSLLHSCVRPEEEFFETTAAVPNGKSVVVIGAGMAGLAAAKRLQGKGYTVTVLEAQEKAGGRIRTNRTPGISFDEGASWIHGPKGNPLTSIAAQSGATTFVTDDENVQVFDINGKAYTDKLLTSNESQYDSAVNAVLKAGTQTQSFQSVFNTLYPSKTSDRLWKYMLSAYTEFDYGGDISQLSSKFFDDDSAFAGLDQIVTNGYDKLTDFLAQGLTIRLNTSVTRIDYTGTKVVVTTSGGIVEANYALVTVPLGVLKNNAIAFQPALPADKQAAVKNTRMGVVNKFLLLWDTPFWNVNLQYIGFTPEMKGKFNYCMNLKKFSPANGLMTFAFGDYAAQTESMSDAQVVAEIMAHLKAIYGSNLPNPRQFLRTKWGINKYAYGSYSFATNGTTSADFDTMAKAVGNKVFFAGEHTHRSYRGTVHGAYLSGIREADKIAALG